MKRYAVLLSLLAASMAVPVASAESYVSEPEVPKGVAGHGGIRCVGEASADGHTFKMVMYFGANGPADREQAWQASRCESKMRRAVVAWAGTAYDGRYCLAWHPESRIRGHNEPDDLYCYKKPAVKIAPSDVRVTVERM